MENPIWIWNWIGGGYNWCRAANRQEAVTQAKLLSARTILQIDESTLRQGTYDDVRKEERRYVGMFD